MRKKTRLIHGGETNDPSTGALSPPIHRASTFKQNGVGNFMYEYSRTGNPTRASLESLIADMERGSHGFACASGIAAITAVIDLFTPGAHIIITAVVCGGF